MDGVQLPQGLSHFEEAVLLFTTKFPEVPGTHFIDHGEDERLSRPWSHPAVLNTGPLDWESSALTTRPLLHKERKIGGTNIIQQHYTFQLCC